MECALLCLCALRAAGPGPPWGPAGLARLAKAGATTEGRAAQPGRGRRPPRGAAHAAVSPFSFLQVIRKLCGLWRVNTNYRLMTSKLPDSRRFLHGQESVCYCGTWVAFWLQLRLTSSLGKTLFHLGILLCARTMKQKCKKKHYLLSECFNHPKNSLLKISTLPSCPVS